MNILKLHCKLPENVVNMVDRYKFKFLDTVFNSFGERDGFTDFHYDPKDEIIYFEMVSNYDRQDFVEKYNNIFDGKTFSTRRGYNHVGRNVTSCLSMFNIKGKVMINTFEKLLPFLEEEIELELRGSIIQDYDSVYAVKTTVKVSKYRTSSISEVYNISRFDNTIKWHGESHTPYDIYTKTKEQLVEKFRKFKAFDCKYEANFNVVSPKIMLENGSLLLMASKSNARYKRSIDIYEYVFFYVRNHITRYNDKASLELFRFIAPHFKSILDASFTQDIVEDTKRVTYKLFNTTVYFNSYSVIKSLEKFLNTLKEEKDNITKYDTDEAILLLESILDGINNLESVHVYNDHGNDMFTRYNNRIYRTDMRIIEHMEAEYERVLGVIELICYKVKDDYKKLIKLILGEDK